MAVWQPASYRIAVACNNCNNVMVKIQKQLFCTLPARGNNTQADLGFFFLDVAALGAHCVWDRRRSRGSPGPARGCAARGARRLCPRALRPVPCAPMPCAPHPVPCALRPVPCSLRPVPPCPALPCPAPRALCPRALCPRALHPAPCAPMPCAPCPAPHALRPMPCTPCPAPRAGGAAGRCCSGGEISTPGLEGDCQRPGGSWCSEIEQGLPSRKREMVKSWFRKSSSVKSRSHALFSETRAGLQRRMTSIRSQLCAIDSIAPFNEEIIIFVRECRV